MQKGQIGIFILVGVLILVSVVGGAYYLGKQNVKPQDVRCTLESKLCPDGSSVGRTGANCEFAQCPAGDNKNLGRVSEDFCHQFNQNDCPQDKCEFGYYCSICTVVQKPECHAKNVHEYFAPVRN